MGCEMGGKGRKIGAYRVMKYGKGVERGVVG